MTKIASIPASTGEQTGLRVKLLQAKDVDRWDAYVDSCPQATFFHRAGWKDVIEKALGHKTSYFYVESDGRIEGILPLGHIRSLLFGNALMSVPFGVYGGIVAESGEAHAILEKAACDLADNLGVDYLEMRNMASVNDTWPTKDLYVTFRKEIDPDSEKNLMDIPRKQRAMVRKGIKAGLVGEVDDDIERFYSAYSESVRNLGTPVLAKRYFKSLKNVFGEECELLTITKDGRTVASVMSFYFKDQVLPYYGGGTDEARRLKGNDFMYWELMRRAGERGIRIFDYGRSKKGTGSYSFKKNWGFNPEPLNYEYYLVKASNIPDVNPLNPKYRLFIDLWKRLPLPVSRAIGHILAKNLG